MTSEVTGEFGLRATGDARLGELVRLGLRCNPRRAHLIVSTVLGKHVPVDPRVLRSAADDLARSVAVALDGSPCVVVGFAETATGLGHGVAEYLGADYVHSTRRVVATAEGGTGFEEEHSHASGHRVLAEDPELLNRSEIVVLVDDELSTGRTVVNTVTALRREHPHSRWIVAVLVDLRTADDAERLAVFAETNGIEIDVVALARGSVSVPVDLPDRVAGVAASVLPQAVARDDRGFVRTYRGRWPEDVRESGRHGFTSADAAAARTTAKAVASELAGDCGSDVLVLATEELMHAPTVIAEALAELLPRVQVSSTTRSPAVVRDVPGYPLRDVLAFDALEASVDGSRERFAYNVGFGHSDLVLVVDEEMDTTELWEGLVEQLRARCERVHVVVLPTYRPLPQPLRGPGFGSYAPDEVGWLLTDLSDVPLEAPIEDREEAIQSGGAHYAESLPIEYQPDAEYRSVFRAALRDSAGRVAEAVGVLTELLLAERGPDIVLASLARAGTPVGVLVRRWARFAHGLDLPHYAISIVRGRGIDRVALRWLASRHDPAAVVFVDGWTGKGAIARELSVAVGEANAAMRTCFSPDLAVLADPGSCVRTFGTRADFLVPSACLNSTVSGLVSRTVLNTAVLAPGQFHGAKHYRELAAVDESEAFLDAVTSGFSDVRSEVDRTWRDVAGSDRTPTWSGWRDVERIADEYGIGDVNLVKPGVGETARVLLRRVPWRVLVRPGAGADLAPIRLLAARRGVPVEEVPDLAYACAGLIHPQYTRGAVGADGRAAAP